MVYAADNPNSPANKMRRLHAACVHVLGDNAEKVVVPVKVWHRILRERANLTTERGRYNYTNEMEEQGMIEKVPREGIRFVRSPSSLPA